MHVEPAARGRFGAAGQHVAAALRQRGHVQHDVHDHVAEVQQPAERHAVPTLAPAAAERQQAGRPPRPAAGRSPRATVARAPARERRHPVAGPQHRPGHRGDRVAVPAGRRGQPAGQPRIAGAAASIANAAGTDSWVARLVPTSVVHDVQHRFRRQPGGQPGGPADPRRHVRGGHPVPAAGGGSPRRPRHAGRHGHRSPSIPALTAAATAAAPASATPVLCVTRLASTTWSTSRRRSSARGGDADRGDPHGRAVGDAVPAGLGDVRARPAARPGPAWWTARAGSSEPRARIDSSQPSSCRANSAASIRPPPSMSSPASSSACSVSSVTVPAGSPARQRLVRRRPAGTSPPAARTGPRSRRRAATRWACRARPRWPARTAHPRARACAPRPGRCTRVDPPQDVRQADHLDQRRVGAQDVQGLGWLSS